MCSFLPLCHLLSRVQRPKTKSSWSVFSGKGGSSDILRSRLALPLLPGLGQRDTHLQHTAAPAVYRNEMSSASLEELMRIKSQWLKHYLGRWLTWRSDQNSRSLSFCSCGEGRCWVDPCCRNSDTAPLDQLSSPCSSLCRRCLKLGFLHVLACT